MLIPILIGLCFFALVMILITIKMDAREEQLEKEMAFLKMLAKNKQLTEEDKLRIYQVHEEKIMNEELVKAQKQTAAAMGYIAGAQHGK